MRRGTLVVGLILAACDGPPDRLVDATVVDAFVADAPVPDAPLPDAAVVDARPPGGAGQACAEDEPYCLEPLYCQWLVAPAEAICTRLCTAAAECDDLGAGACCAAPGVTSSYRVCQPAVYCRVRTLRSSSSTIVAPTFTP